MMRKSIQDTPLVVIARPGELLLEQSGRAADVLAVGSDGVLVAERPAGRRGSRLRFRFLHGDVTRDLEVRSIEERDSDFGKAYFLKTVPDPRLPRLAELLNRGLRTSAGFIRAAGDMALNRRGPSSSNSWRIAKFAGGAVGLVLAGALFLGTAYMRYGVSTFSGSIEPKSVELLRAEHPGVFFPYTPGSGHVLAVGELVGVHVIPRPHNGLGAHFSVSSK